MIQNLYFKKWQHFQILPLSPPKNGTTVLVLAPKKKNGARTVGNGIHFLFYYVKIQNIIYYHHLFTQERAFCHQKIPTDRYNSRIKSVPAKAKFRFTEILCVSWTASRNSALEKKTTKLWQSRQDVSVTGPWFRAPHELECPKQAASSSPTPPVQETPEVDSPPRLRADEPRAGSTALGFGSARLGHELGSASRWS